MKAKVNAAVKATIAVKDKVKRVKLQGGASEWNFVDGPVPAARKAGGVGFQMGCGALITVALITTVYIIDLEAMSVVGKRVMGRYHEVRARPHGLTAWPSGGSPCGHSRVNGFKAGGGCVTSADLQSWRRPRVQAKPFWQSTDEIQERFNADGQAYTEHLAHMPDDTIAGDAPITAMAGAVPRDEEATDGPDVPDDQMPTQLYAGALNPREERLGFGAREERASSGGLAT
jgi:hypothetical protein